MDQDGIHRLRSDLSLASHDMSYTDAQAMTGYYQSCVTQPRCVTYIHDLYSGGPANMLPTPQVSATTYTVRSTSFIRSLHLCSPHTQDTGTHEDSKMANLSFQLPISVCSHVPDADSTPKGGSMISGALPAPKDRGFTLAKLDQG